MAIFFWFCLCIAPYLCGMQHDERVAGVNEWHHLVVVNNPIQLFDLCEPYLSMPAGYVVVACDIDKTVGVTNDPRLSSEYFDYNINIVHQLVPATRWADPFATTMDDLCALHETAHMVPLDHANSVGQVVWLLQRHGIPVFGLTARSVPLKRDTVRQVGQDLGINFSRLSVLSGGDLSDDLTWQPALPAQQVAPAAIFKGIGFCGVNPKGVMLRGMLALLHLSPRVIIFADDDCSKIQSVFAAFPDRYVLGIHMQVANQDGYELQKQLASEDDMIVVAGKVYPKLYSSIFDLIKNGVKRGSAHDLMALQSPQSPHSPWSPGPYSCSSISVRRR
jgi:hypothetical protein